PAFEVPALLVKLVAEGKRRGLEMIGYYCIVWDNVAALTHPEWRFIGPEGKPMHWHEQNAYSALHTWNVNCFMGGYREYCLAQIKEFCTNYDIDGVFLDAFALGADRKVVLCHCPTCMERYKRLGLDPYSTDPEMRMKLGLHWMQNYADFIKDVRAVMDSTGKKLSLSQNGGLLVTTPEVLDYMDWAYNEGGEHPYNSVALRGVNKPAPQCGIPAGNDAYDVWPPSIVRLMTSNVLAQGCRTFFFFLQGRYPDGTFEESKYRLLAEINAETAQKQEFVKGASALKAAAVYHSELTQIWRGGDSCCGFNDGTPASSYYRRTANAIDMIRRQSIPCELVTGSRASLSELQQYQLIILPECTIITQHDKQLLEEYVRTGGTLVATGETGLVNENGTEREEFALADLFGIKYEGKCEKYYRQGSCGFFRMTADSEYFSEMRKADYYYPAGAFLQVKADGASVLAVSAEPIDVESETNHIGWGFLPPGKNAPYAALTEHKYGRGSAIYCASPLGLYSSLGIRWCAYLIKGILKAKRVSCGIDLLDHKEALKATYFEKDGAVLVHLVNDSVINNGGDVVPVTCRVSCPGFTGVQTVYPEMSDVRRIDGEFEATAAIHTILKLTR
ncbi:MAG TPA: beta-galactosidase trimerization domain-containing protein, partial [Bacillota bacterium]|nr:beta-galactosidase trimerization domain-containing protein [Bacillota bacterium]